MSQSTNAGGTAAGAWSEWMQAAIAAVCLAGIVVFTWLQLH